MHGERCHGGDSILAETCLAYGIWEGILEEVACLWKVVNNFYEK